MKKVYAILTERDEQSTDICDAMAKLPVTAKFCGCWGKIQSNRNECLSAILTAVNHVIALPEVECVIFACDQTDVADVERDLSFDDLAFQRVPASCISTQLIV